MDRRWVYFGSWRCNCTTLTEAANEIPSVCPEHGEYLLGREPALIDAGVPLGFERAE